MIFRSRDYAAIRELLTHPKVFRHVSDDYFNDPNTWQPIESELVIYLLARDGEGVCGCGIFVPYTRACFDSHVAFLPRAYGAFALNAFQEMLGWIWRETSAARIVGQIRRENRRAIAFAQRAGFREYGVNEKSTLYGGHLRDQVCLGLSKP